MYEETTIAAIATGSGEGGIGIIRISGISACDIAERVFYTKKLNTFKDAVPYKMYFGYVKRDEKKIDEGLVVYMKAPHSYTGEDVVEIQIHGSQEALRQTLELVLEKGATIAERGEFTKRAFLNGRLDLTQAEAVMDIIEAKNAVALTQAESHLSGALSKFVHENREKMKDLITKLEVTIDYPDEDLKDLTRHEMETELSEIEKILHALLETSKKGRIIKDGIRTAIVGKPNAGKSSLLNTLLQEERAIVTDIPGTTRDTIEESISLSGIPLILMDTAGIRKTENKVEKIGIERARESMEKADLVLMVIDSSKELEESDKKLLEEISKRKAVVLLNKSDLEKKTTKETVSKYAKDLPVLEISAKNKTGMNKLEKVLEDYVKTGDIEDGRALFLTNLRHIDLVKKAYESVIRAKESLQLYMPADCIVVDLTESWNILGEITGDTVDDELINSIFSRFCVGK